MKSILASSLLLALASAATLSPRKVTYDGAKVVRLSVGEEVEKVSSLIDELDLSSWTGSPREGSLIDLVVPADKTGEFDEATADMETQIMHEDLGASIAEESRFERFSAPDLTWFNSYHPYADHVQYLTDLQAQFPENSALFSPGNSLEGRAIPGIHLYGSGGPGTKPAIVFHATVHAREWITAMVVEYMTYSLLNNYSNDTQVAGFLDNYDFYILPVVNPDGFVFSQTTDRLWRKNRQTLSGTSCVGRDINRNWDAFWSQPQGASTNPCAQDFKGRAAADAPETQVHQAFLMQLSASEPGLKMFIDWHSYSQLMMTPWGAKCNEVAPNDAEHQSLATAFAQALRAVYGTRYQTGPICTTIYQVSGGSTDFAYEKANAEFTFAAELRDTGRYGFVLPPNQIVPSGIETFAGLRALLAGLN